MIRQCWIIIVLDERHLGCDDTHPVTGWVLFGYKKQVEVTPNGLTTHPPGLPSSSLFFFFFAILLLVGASSGISLPRKSCPTASKKSLPLLRSLAGSLPACAFLILLLLLPPLLAIISSLFTLIFFALLSHLILQFSSSLSLSLSLSFASLSVCE